MKYILKDALKNEYIFFNPKSVTLIREKNVPADSLDVLFSFWYKWNRIC